MVTVAENEPIQRIVAPKSDKGIEKGQRPSSSQYTIRKSFYKDYLL